MALSIDLAPTLLELGGVKPSPGIQGRSLVPLLHGEKTDWRSSFLIEYYSDRTMRRMLNMGYRAVRTNEWKYIQYTDLQGMDELYDLQSDPYEIHNLIVEPSAQKKLDLLRRELRRLLAA